MNNLSDFVQSLSRVKLWDVERPYNDQVVVDRANDILSGIMHCWPSIQGLEYDLSNFDWSVKHSRMWNTFQLYLQSLNPVMILTRAFELTNEHEFLEYCERIILSWYNYKKSVNKTENTYLFCDHSVALRANNLIYFGKIYISSGKENHALVKLLYDIMEECGYWLKDKKNYVPEHNHGIMEDEALLHLGYCMDVSDWILLAKERLVKQFESAFNKDGVHTENSTGYHNMVKWIFFRINKYIEEVEEASDLHINLDKIEAYSRWIIMPNGLVCQVGDSGTGKSKYGTKESMQRNSNENHRMFSDGGIYFFRSNLDDNPMNDTYKMIKSGYNKTTHKHADDGSFVLYSKGYEIFSDCGMYGYLEDDFRRYIVSANAHNDIVVDGISWDTSKENYKNVGIAEWKFCSNFDYICTFNNAYSDVYMERDFYSMDDLTVIQDRMYSTVKHNYTQLFHLSEDMRIIQAENQMVRLKIGNSDYYVSIRQHCPTELKVYGGEIDKAGYGLISRGFNILDVTTTLAFNIVSSNGRFLTTVTVEDVNGNVRLFNHNKNKSNLEYKQDLKSLMWDDLLIPVNEKIMKNEKRHEMENSLDLVHWYDECLTMLSGCTWITEKNIEFYNHHILPWREIVELIRIFAENHVSSILDLGLGESSKIIAQYASYAHANHVILDADPQYSKSFLQASPAIFAKTKVHISPLIEAKKEGRNYRCFSRFKNVIGNSKFNLILQHCPRGDIDAPYADIAMWLRDLLEDEFVILLENADGAKERFLATDMLAVLQGDGIKASKKYIPLPQGELCVIKSDTK